MIRITKFFISIGILSVAIGMASADSIVMTQQPTIVNNKCQFEMSYRFSGATVQLAGLAPEIPNFTRGGDNPEEIGNAIYNITYTMGVDEENTFSAQIPAGAACYGPEKPCSAANKNVGSSLFTQLISCTAQQTDLNNANCSGQAGTVYNSATDQCEISTAPTIGGGAAVVCDPPADASEGEQCIEGRRVCVPGTPGVCCGIKLNTTVPFIGKCIQMVSSADKKLLQSKGLRNVSNETIQVTEDTAFPRLMLGLTKILVTVILLASFIAIIVAGVMMAASGDKEEGYSNGTKIIGSVIAALALLGASGVILRLINPNFFG